MTKKWSSTRSDLLKTKRQASKEVRSEMAKELNRLDQEPPEATFNNVDDMLKWLNAKNAAR